MWGSMTDRGTHNRGEERIIGGWGPEGREGRAEELGSSNHKLTSGARRGGVSGSVRGLRFYTLLAG